MPVLIFFFAWFVRAVVYWIGGYERLGGDEFYYWRSAHTIMRGHVPTGAFMPGWPALMSLPLMVHDHVLVARVFTMTLGALGCALVAALGTKVMDQRAGFFAGVLFSLYPDHVFSSHYIYAEVGLGTVLVALTLAVFRYRFLFLPERQRLAIAFFFGVAMLYKHFAILCFAAFFLCVVVFFRPRFRELACIALMFGAAPAFQAVGLAAMGRDPAMALRSPLKSTREWNLDRMAAGPRTRNVLKAATELTKQSASQGPRFYWRRGQSNLRRLWGARSYPVDRLWRGGYRRIFRGKRVIPFFKSFQLALLLLGMTGLFFRSRPAFQLYAATTLGLLTLMCFQFFMVTRYRMPFMFVPAVLAGGVLANPKATFMGFRSTTLTVKGLWAFSLGLIAYNVMRTW